MNRTFCNDRDFGPIAYGCRNDFDFTLLFENTVLSIIPSIIVFILGAGRIIYLCKKPKLLWARAFQLSKVQQTALVLYATMQAALTVLWALQPSLRSLNAILAASLSLLNAFLFCSMSFLEHARSIRPSSVLITYLLFSTMFDIVRCRTLWQIAPDSSLTRLFTASVVFKTLVLALESGEKTKYLPPRMSERRPEETSSILNRGIFYWLNRIMIRGSRRILLLEELYELKDNITAEQLGISYLNNWQHTRDNIKHKALWTTVKTLKWPLLAPIFPRAALLGLTICQPIVLRELLTYLSTPEEETSKNTGYGLIGAYALVYTGSAVATGFYWHKHYQFLTMVRGCLVSAISWRTANLNLLAVNDPKAAVTLMSTDVERITEGLRSLHDFWASLIQIGVSLYLLQQQMGVACVVPIIICILCSVSAAIVSSWSNVRQVKWTEAVQARIGVTSAMLSSMKSVKMRGLTDGLTDTVQKLRRHEIEYANKWRTILLLAITFAFVPEYISPVATFMVYIIQARASGAVFDVARAFTSLSLLMIMTQPLNSLLQAVPGATGAVACFDRIGKFLSSDEQNDFRDLKGSDLFSPEPQASSQALPGYPDAIQLEHRSFQSSSKQTVIGKPAIRITQGSFSWSDDNDILTDVNITIPHGQLTCIVGPVASGKSTLCQALLGETRATKGQVELFTPSKRIAYCHQTAHLINGTIKENIIGFSETDGAWYETVLRLCALQEDIQALPKQHDTIVGSTGVNLSGGQRQKVALARAIYARLDMLILDDIFSGFDAGSEQHIFFGIFGPGGLARRHGMTVVFATHAIKFLPFTDHIIALDTNGSVVQEGPYDKLREQPGYIQGLAIDDHPTGRGIATLEPPTQVDNAQIFDENAKQELSRQLGEFAVYRYYFSAAGLRSTLLMFFFGAGCSVFFNLPTFWLKLWTDASPATAQRHDYKFLGIYGLFQCLALFFLMMVIYHILINVVAKTGLQLHLQLLRTVASASLLFFSTTDSGAITNRFSQDMQLIDSQLPFGLSNLTLTSFIAVGQIVLIIVSSPWVGLTFPFILTVFYFVQKFYLRTSRQLRFLDLEAKSPLYTNFLETLGGLATIRAFGWTKQNLDLNYKLLDQSQKPVYLMYMIQRWLTFVLDVIVAILAVIIAALAVLQRGNSGFAGVALTQVLVFNMTLRVIIISWTEVETSIGSVSRIKSFSETTASEHKLLETNEPAVDWPHAGKIEFIDLNAIYETAPDEPALRNLSLSIQPGERVGVCGRSGSGKSSLVLALFRMLEIQSGSLMIDGLDLQQLRRNTIRERLNVIPQEPMFLPGTVQANLDPRNECTRPAMVEALKKVQLWSVFETKGGLDAGIDSDKLSHGQRQLFSLASAILRKSKVVVLDEATSNVDHETDELMQRIIREEFRGCTLIAIAHRLNTIMDYDRIAVLDHGILCELDSPQALLSRDSRFRSMWGERESNKTSSESVH